MKCGDEAKPSGKGKKSKFSAQDEAEDKIVAPNSYALNQRSAQNPWDTDVVLAMTKLDTVISKTEEDIKQDEEISKEAMKRYDTLNGGN